MLTTMWVFPLVAAVVAFVFAGTLAARYGRRRQAYQLAWAIALGMYGIASLMAVLGVVNGWTTAEFAAYWALGAVLNVPFLAGGEVMLLARSRTVDLITWLVLIFVVAYTVAVVRHATMDAGALLDRLPSGKEVFGDATAPHRLPQLISIPSYMILLVGTLWSAWTMRGRPDLRDRFVGTLLIAVGATIVAGGATFAAFGNLPGFCVTLVAGIVVMYLGFLRASAKAPSAAPLVPS
jgi:uncharacterized membrane protein